MIDRDHLAWLAADIEVRRADLASGLVPPDATRALFPHEVAAGTDFAAIEQSVDRTAGELAKHMDADRAAFIALLEADLAAVASNPGVLPVDVAVAQRLMDLGSTLGISAIPGVSALVTAAEARYRDVLAEAATQGGQRAHQEAAHQGVPLAGSRLKLTGLDEYRIDLMARRLAQAPHADVLAAAADDAYRVPEAHVGGLRQQVIGDLRQMSPQPLLTTLARPAVQQVDGIGRIAAMTGLPTPTKVYASALNDKSTCQACAAEDGHVYATLAEGKADFPSGGYVHCLGGDRCRCTLVSVWAEHAYIGPGDT